MASDGVNELGEQRAAPVGRRRTLNTAAALALLVSLAAHAVVLLVAALIALDVGEGGLPGDEGSVIEMAVLPEADLADEQSGEMALAEFEVADAAPSTDSFEVTADLASAASSVTADASLSGVSLGGGALGEGATGDLGAGAIGGGGASFFGVEAAGRRFVYIVDRSGSMARDGKMDHTRLELSGSVAGLADTAEFAVVMFNATAEALPAPLSWRFADQGAKRRFAQQLPDASNPSGGTAPLPAFQLVFSALDPPPDAIYFMTDASFPGELGDLVDQLARLNRSPRVPIHCIMFGKFDDPRERDRVKQVLDRIARQSRGTSVFRPVDGP